MKIAVLSETSPGERRVSASPDTVKAYVKKGLTVGVQAGAGCGRAYFRRGFCGRRGQHH